MPHTRELHLTLQSNLASVDASELIVQRLAQEHGFSEDQMQQLGMAVREAVVNAVTHGNGYSKEKSVYLSVVTDPDRFTVTVKDEGPGFNPDEVPDPLREDNILRVSGRGLLLMRSFFDEVNINPVSPVGLEVEMVKYSEKESGRKEEEVSLTTSVREVDGVAIVDLSGRITLGEGSGKLRDTIREILSKGQKKILLNLGDVSYIDSSGLGELVSSYTTASNQGAQLKLVNVQKKVHDLLQITKLYTVFDTFDDEGQAILSFS